MGHADLCEREGADLCERESERVDTDLCEREGEEVLCRTYVNNDSK